MNGLFETLQRVTGVAPPRRHIPYAMAAFLGFTLHAWAELTGQPPLLTHQVVDVFREHWAYSSAKAQASPRIPAHLSRGGAAVYGGVAPRRGAP